MRILSAILSAAILLSAPAPVGATETVAVVVSGKAAEPALSYSAGGELYLDAKSVGEMYGGQTYWYPVSGRVSLALRGRALQFVVDADKATAGSESFALAAPVIARAGRAFIPVSFLVSEPFARWSGFDAHYDAGAKTLGLERRVAAVSDRPRRRTVVVDAGHGGKDPGAIGARGTKEKDITLAAASELARVLRERGDFEVVLTRDSDVFVPLSDRSKKANDLNADLFISLHCNAALNKRERGFEIYSVSETASDPEAERLAAAENAALELEGKNPEDESAKQILLAMTKTEMINESAPFAALVERSVGKRVDLPDRGHKQAGFYVLRGTHAPSVLVEMAFVSHPREEAELGSRSFRRKMAEGVAAGISEYARKKGWLE